MNEKYKSITIETDIPEEGAFTKRADLTENFFIFLNDNPVIVDIPIKRLNWTTAVLNKNTLEIMPYASTNDLINEWPFVPYSSKIGKAIYETDLSNLDAVFNDVIDFLKNRNKDGAVRCFYIKSLIWLHVFHPTAFAPIPGIIICFFEFKL